MQELISKGARLEMKSKDASISPEITNPDELPSWMKDLANESKNTSTNENSKKKSKKSPDILDLTESPNVDVNDELPDWMMKLADENPSTV